ncbi:MAG: pyruvate kinase [Saezia sp.]
MRKTKIVCTLGPSTADQDMIEELLNAGMNVARFNFSHGSHEGHREHMKKVRAASEKMGKPVGILLDTKGPEMRLGRFKDGKVQLKKGQSFTLTGRDVDGDENIVSVNHKNLPHEVKAGDSILLSDGLVSLTVEKIVDGQDIVTTVDNSGVMSNNKRVAVPGANLSLPFLSDKDVEDIQLGIAEDIDFIAASFVQRAEDVLAMKALLKEKNASVWIIAKIENAEGVKNVEEILAVADGIMVARGDLGVEIPAEEVPLIQKKIIKLCNKAGKPVITATQMLESMTTNPRPTRAEASDVANAILDGTDAVMLSGETASGSFPIESVKTMSSIANHIETALKTEDSLFTMGLTKSDTTNAISHATVQISHEINAKGIITATESGFTARMVSKYRPSSGIFVVTPHLQTLRKLQLVWGVTAIQGQQHNDTDAMTSEAIAKCLEKKFISTGDLVVVTAGVPIGLVGTTNMIQVHVA